MGQLVRKRVDELGIRHASLAEQINVQPQTMNHIYKRKMIDSELLIRLSKALGKNFFQEFANAIDEEYGLLTVVREDAEEYKTNVVEKHETVVIELTGGKVTKVEHVKDSSYANESKLLQLERMIIQLTESLRSAGLPIKAI